ncbi:MAG: protein kinase domain-containing protein [Acidobacteriota bacterium]
MTLAAGRRLGPYEIQAPLGAGGMGEVYRARDTRLGRTVAVKVLREPVGASADLRQRFEREARAVSSLNHPRICTLYDVGHHEGIDFLVIELVEGETLATRIGRGPLPIDEALAIAREMADALDHAHRRGVIHRDLKPSNVMLTKAGVKLLDFGLAKMRETPSGAGVVLMTEATKSMQPGPITAQGTLLGTLQYMAPEQIEGKDADARSDLFAFGAVLYEMVTGRRAFGGESPASVIAAILGSEPAAVSTVRPLAPAALDRLVRGCLAKDLEERWQDARDLRRALDAIADEPGQASPPSRDSAAGRKGRAERTIGRIGLLVGAAALAVAAVLVLWSSQRSAAPRPVVRSVLPIAPAEELDLRLIAISPDGVRVAFSGTRAGLSQLYLLALDHGGAQPIPGTEGGSRPFFSPDGRWLGFEDGTLKRVALTGGAPLTICSGCGNQGSSWSADDTIVSGAGGSGLLSIPVAGGRASPLTIADKTRGERTLRFPDVLPGGKAVVFTAAGWEEATYDEARIEVLTVATGEKKVLIEGGSCARYASSGHLIYGRAGALFAVAFDPVRLEVKGAPVKVLDDVATVPINGTAHFALSREGTLVYAPGRSMGVHHRFVWVDRQRRIEPLGDIERAFERPRLSSDGQRIAVTVEGAVAGLATYDIPRGTLTRLTQEDGNVWTKAWTPDGKRLVYSVGPLDGSGRLFWRAADGSGSTEALVQGSLPGSWLPDGKSLVYVRSDSSTQADLWLLALGEGRTARQLLNDRFDQYSPEISPDGRWMAYVSEESGRAEVFVRAFPGLGQKMQVSGNGGGEPLWSRDGGELFYIEGQTRLMVSKIRTRPTLTVSRATVAFEDKDRRYLKHGYDVAPDGRFLLVDENEQWPRQLNLVQNWLEEVTRLVPR